MGRLEKREERLNRLAELIREGPNRTTEEYAELTGVYFQTVRKDIAEIKRRGAIPEGYRTLTRTQAHNAAEDLEMRPVILKGIAEGSSYRSIARGLGVGWIRVNSVVLDMQRERDPRLTEATEKRDRVQRKRRQAALEEARRPPKPRRVRPPKQPKAPKHIIEQEARLSRLRQLIEEEPGRTSRELGALLGVNWQTSADYVRELKKRGTIPRSFQLLTERQARVLGERVKRRPKVLEGVAVDRTLKAIAEGLNTSFAVISLDVKNMKAIGDRDLMKAIEARDQIREEKRRNAPGNVLDRAVKEADAFFMESEGLNLKQRNLVNMASYFRAELLGILSGEVTVRGIDSKDRRALTHAKLIDGLNVTWDGLAALFTIGARHPKPLKWASTE